jgi:hypothetical protein
MGGLMAALIEVVLQLLASAWEFFASRKDK